MWKKLLLFLVILFCADSLHAQSFNANLTTASTACGGNTSCLIVPVTPSSGGATFTLAGTYSGTNQFEATGNNGTSWVALSVTPSNSTTTVTSATGVGTWQANTAGYTAIRIRVSTYSSGTVGATITLSNASARVNGSAGGGGSGCVPAGSAGQLLADDGAGACSSSADFVITSHTLAGGASSVTDLSAASATAGLILPKTAGAAPTTEAAASFNSTSHLPVWGFNGASTVTIPVSRTNTSHQWINTYNQATGFFTSSQPACADISDAGTGCTGSSTVPWSVITNGSGNLGITPGGTSIFSTTSALNQFFAWKNSTAAIVSASQGSPLTSWCGRAFHGSADAEDCITASELPGNGNDAAIAFNFAHTGTSTGTVTTNFPGAVSSGNDAVHAGYLSLPGNTTNFSAASNTAGFMGPSSASFTAYALQLANAAPAAGTLMATGAPSSAVSQVTYVTALPSGFTATTQTAKDNSTKVATTAYVDTPTGLTAGTSITLAAPRQYFVCTSTCTVTVPVPAAGYEFCVMNDDNVTTVITMAAIGSSARYENTARTAYGTAGTGTFVSGGAAADKVCLLGRDSTHYLTASFNGTWTAN